MSVQTFGFSLEMCRKRGFQTCSVNIHRKVRSAIAHILKIESSVPFSEDWVNLLEEVSLMLHLVYRFDTCGF